MEDESVFHAFVTCPKARALRMELRGVWNISRKEVFNCSGPDWMLILLDRLTPTVSEQILFMFWSDWHLHNDLAFAKGKESVSNSANFGDNYWTMFSSCHHVEIVT
jgi:hypothetical protein